MSMMTMTAESLSKEIGEPIPEIYVLIAKNSIVGMDSHAIADLLGSDVAEVEEAQQSTAYKSVRLLLASEYSRTQLESDFNWDDIESTALKSLAERVPYEKDTDTLLRIAAVANKAQRRNMPNSNRVLDPSQGGARVSLNLTSRLVKKLNSRTGEQTVEETRQISVLDGSASNPTFEDIDKLLGVSQRPPAIPSKMTIHTHESDFSVDDLEFPAPARLMKP